ncbi:MAG: amidophosphoribosyltransferase, partial [Clostridia bacterium]|nr:amidophosphoribosyltransferase [Clostridia bacterium]
CYYGTDIDNPNKLIANNHSVEEIRNIIGVDSLGYLSIENLLKTPGAKVDRTYCTACFDLNYPTEVPTQTFVDKFDNKLSDKGDKK